ncbi:helix-turn-helix transcriptional regulator [Lysinibacillus macroides]|uniref:helix-turn-helix domain-containing protein n=1 Tax=Lysinibacillus macroides TaxID=33935 RepID=UPI0006B431AE|nr:helix-turn-helix transcriptional regulator [Lysinibacillus macroides]QPR69620.1 helix-turn-helix transcriptional regulator [Lysinibacillus macroides]
MKKSFDGQKLKTLRKSKGFTTQQVADNLHVSQSYISRFENNRAVPDVDMLANILDVLGTSISDFYSDTPDIAPDLLNWLEVGKELTPVQRQSLLEAINQLRDV